MTYTLVIPGRLPGLNEYIDAERSHRQAAAKLKREQQEYITWQIRAQLKGVRIDGPVRMRYTWVEQNRRRDLDNIAWAKKFIQDALVKAGVLGGDGWRYIADFSDVFQVDAENPRIVVEIITRE